MKKFLATLTLALAFVGSAFAQTFTTSAFSANFNGAVSTDTFRSKANTSNNVQYGSFANGITETVIVRTVDHDIPVDLSSSQFYRSNTTDLVLVTKYNSDGTYQGHPYSYGYFTYTNDNVNYVVQERIIIVNSRTAIFISMTMTEAQHAETPNVPNTSTIQVWQDFENSLDIK
jgi:hypothetical protein